MEDVREGARDVVEGQPAVDGEKRNKQGNDGGRQMDGWMEGARAGDGRERCSSVTLRKEGSPRFSS